jgi:DNA-binding beta-propeller fold protein YncE
VLAREYDIFGAAGGALRVYDPVAAAPAFDVGTGLTYIGGSAFSDNGDTLFVVARDTSVLLLAVNASTGALLRQVRLGGYEPGDVLTTPLGRWIFIANGASVDVLDRGSLARVATLGHPRGMEPSTDVLPARVNWVVGLADPFRNRVYVISLYWAAFDINQYEFEVMP